MFCISLTFRNLVLALHARRTRGRPHKRSPSDQLLLACRVGGVHRAAVMSGISSILEQLGLSSLLVLFEDEELTSLELLRSMGGNLVGSLAEIGISEKEAELIASHVLTPRPPANAQIIGGPSEKSSIALVTTTWRTSSSRADWRVRLPPATPALTEDQSNAAALKWRSEGSTFPQTTTLVVEVLEAGPAGAPIAAAGDTVEMHYAALIRHSGCCVDASRSKAFGDRSTYKIQLRAGPAQEVVEGMACGVMSLSLGSIARLHVPSRLAYGPHQSGPVAPHTDLVFEVEILAINGQRAAERDHWRTRQLLMLPPVDPLPGSQAYAEQPSAPTVAAAHHPLNNGSRAILVHHPPAVLAAALDAMARARDTFDADSSEAIGVDARDHGLPTWLTRLRPTRPLPTPECKSYYGFAKLHAELLAALPRLEVEEAAARAGGGATDASSPSAAEIEAADLGTRLMPGASPIAHMPYGTKWDSSTPVVLTGERVGWPAKEWGWEFWEREYGHHFVVCKQRAPLFHEDQTADTLMAECTLREALHYARTSHASDAASRGEAPVLYMNGWDLFEALPELWHPDMDQLPGSIEHLTASEFKKLHVATGIGLDGDEMLTKKSKALCKLFVGPVGAITRIHQDNQNAHAWLCNIRGRKLYVLARPSDTPKVALRNSGSKGYGTKYDGRLDPLDPAARAAARASKLELFATVLEPGQTILAPDGWWHYAVSLTPTITLMCNFWDRMNLYGLHDSFFDQVARVVDSTKKQGGNQVQLVARADAHSEVFDPPRLYRCIFKPFVYVRDEPSTTANMIGILRPSSKDYGVLRVDRALDGWLRTAEPFDRGSHGWVLEDGKAAGLPLLMERLPEDLEAEVSRLLPRVDSRYGG